jgi:ABC-2 type transport system ATP-binding protein
LPEERGLYKKMKVGEQALYLAQLKGTPKHEALKKLKFWFQRFEIEQWWGKKVEELSKGMQQKIQFITTVLHNPSLLIFDEPFSGFDPINANILKEEILNLKNNGATIIFSTHNMGSVEELCDNITLINNGKAILSGNVNELRQKYRKNIARLDFSGNTEEISAIIALDFQIIETSQINNITSKLIQLPHSSKINDLLKSVINKCHIHSCQEILPGMNEIFIDTVTSSK